MIGGALSRARGVFSKCIIHTPTISSIVPNREIIPSETPWCYIFYRFRPKCNRYPLCTLHFTSIDAYNEHIKSEICVPPGERKNAKKKAQPILTTLTPQESRAALAEEKSLWETLLATVRRHSQVFDLNPQGLRGAATSKSKLYMFGPIDMGNYVDYLEVLELKCFTWSRIHFWMDPSSEPSDVLRPIYGYSLITWRNSVLVVAGFTEDDPSPVVTVKQIDAETHAFSTIMTNGQPPGSRHGQSVTVVGTKMLIFGGQNASASLLNDLHMLDMETMLWTHITTATGVPPNARFNHDAACYADRYLFIYGGTSNVRSFYDLHVLDLKMMEWSSEQSGPLQHRLGPAVKVGENWYLVGEMDTAVLHFPSRVWSILRQ